VVAILGALGPEAAEVIRKRAAAVGAPVLARGEAFEVSALELPLEPGKQGAPDGIVQRIRFESPGRMPIEAGLSVVGTAAVANAGLAIACVCALGGYDEDTLRQAVRTGLARAALPGRIEILANDPAVLIDAAHTARSAQNVAETLARLAPEGFDLLVSISSDKNVDAVLAALLPGARRVWLTRADALRSADPALLVDRIRARRPDLPIEVVPDPAIAARTARAALPPGRRLCAVGSVYLAGITRQTLGPDSERSRTDPP
jgi:dihydrofolate synthase/folylpolyglutamate synthase